jgi:siroheme synthase-like protein
LLDVTDRPIVIVGGGHVAARKALALIAAGAVRIRCISPEFVDDFPAAVERIGEEYSDRRLEGAGLVFAATNRPEVNGAVVRDARRRGIIVNRADGDESDPGDFSTPAKFQDGPVIVAVSAGSAALAAAVRDRIARTLDRRFAEMAGAMQSLRPEIKASKLSPARRADVFRALAGDEAMAALSSGGIESLRAWLLRLYPEIKHG